MLGAFAITCANAGFAQDAQMPSLEFFEYLGSLVETDGKWIGPEDMDGPIMEDDPATELNVDSAQAEESQ